MSDPASHVLTAPESIRPAAAFTLPLRAGTLLLRTPGLRVVALLPLLVSIIVYAVVMSLAFWCVVSWQPEWVQTLGQVGAAGMVTAWAATVLKWIIVVPVVWVLVYFSFTTVGMIVAAPFNDLLSSRVEQVMWTAAPETVNAPWVWQVIVTMMGSLRLLVLQVLLSLASLPFLLIPIVGFLPLFLIIAYFGGLAMVDVAVARHDPTAGRLRRVLTGRRRQVLALGIAIELLFFVPFAALLVLPLGVTAGTILYGAWKGEGGGDK